MFQRVLHGQTLLSLMLAMSLSVSLMFILSRFFSQIQIANQQQFAYLQLQQDLESRLEQIVRDIRRAGFLAANPHLVESNFQYFQQDGLWKALQIGAKDSEPSQSCVLFFYDLDHSGCIGGKFNSGHADDKKTYCVRDGYNLMRNIEKELFGYRLNQGMLQTRSLQKKDVDPYCDKQTCRKYTATEQCNLGKWESLFDKNKIKISSLVFRSLADGKGLQIYIYGQLRQDPKIKYETSAVVPLINLWVEDE